MKQKRDMKERWAGNWNTRFDNACNSFVEYAMRQAKVTARQAEVALVAYRKAKAITLDPVSGTFKVKHGAFLDVEVIRRAAGLEA